MKISAKDWQAYVNKLSSINKKAGELLSQYIDQHGFYDREALIDYANALVSKYGEAGATLACQLYDELAEIQKANVPLAEPATIANRNEVAGAIVKTKGKKQATMAVERLVKLSASDTILKNAKRDHAEWAWVSRGDTCAFCITLASQGWMPASKAVMKGDHAEHIHAHCDCEFCIRFDGKSSVEGYDPKKYLKMYEDAEGTKPIDKINAMRREKYADIKDERNARRRELYVKNKAAVYKTFASGEEANKYFKEEEKRWTSLLSDSEKNAINGYTGTDFTKINSNLRTSTKIMDDFELDESITNVDNAISKFRLDDNITVYRVVDPNGLQGLNLNNCIGEIYNDKAYMSASVSYKGILDGIDDSFTVFKINVPKGKGNGAYINSLSQYQDAEYEFLLKRNTKCRILKVEEIDDKKLLEMEVILDD